MYSESRHELNYWIELGRALELSESQFASTATGAIEPLLE